MYRRQLHESREMPPEPLVLSSSQMLKIAEWRSFPLRLLVYIEQLLQAMDREIDRPKLSLDIRKGIRHAAYYQLRTEFEVASFVETVCVVLDGCFELPIAARQVLYDHRQTSQAKLERFRRWAIQANAKQEVG